MRHSCAVAGQVWSCVAPGVLHTFFERPMSPARKFLHAWRRKRALARLQSEWTRLAASAYATALDEHCILVVPSDPATLVGARGDEAMMSAVLDTVQASRRLDKVLVLTATDEASAAALASGMQPLQVWRFDGPLGPMVDAIDAHAPASVVVIGADIMDGYYSPGTTLRVLALADLSRRRGAHVTITGYSFNEHPSPVLAAAFERVDAGVALNLRDPISLDRFRRFCRASPVEVADVAFLLTPDASAPEVADLATWADARRSSGQVVVAINLHPMLVKDASEAQIDALVTRVSQAMAAFSRDRSIAWLLLPHDFRGAQGDDVCLEPVERRLRSEPDVEVRRLHTALSAAQLKAVAACVDGVLTGRMHLAIAALGSGVPVGGFTYQDKFQGLLRHFDLPTDLLLSPAEMLEPQRIETLLARFVDALPALRAQVAAKLPHVRELSARNLEPLLDRGGAQG